MKRVLFLMFVMCGVLLLVAPPVLAIPTTVDFTAQNFDLDKNGNNPPIDIVSGTIVLDASSITGEINSIISISMTIDGHIYGLSEVGFEIPSVNPYREIYGLLGGAGTSGGTNDFQLYLDKVSLEPYKFSYSSSNYSSGPWYTFQQGIVSSVSVVPAPSTMLLFGSGLAGLVGYTKVRLKRKSATKT